MNPSWWFTLIAFKVIIACTQPSNTIAPRKYHHPSPLSTTLCREKTLAKKRRGIKHAYILESQIRTKLFFFMLSESSFRKNPTSFRTVFFMLPESSFSKNPNIFPNGHTYLILKITLVIPQKIQGVAKCTQYYCWCTQHLRWNDENTLDP